MENYFSGLYGKAGDTGSNPDSFHQQTLEQKHRLENINYLYNEEALNAPFTPGELEKVQ